MEDAKKLAAENSTSLNQFFLVTIAAKIGEAKTKKYFEGRSQLADIDAVRAILARTGGGFLTLQSDRPEPLPPIRA